MSFRAQTPQIVIIACFQVGVGEVDGTTTPRHLGVIPHPGVSALKKEHGVLVNRPNVSEIGKIFLIVYLCTYVIM